MLGIPAPVLPREKLDVGAGPSQGPVVGSGGPVSQSDYGQYLSRLRSDVADEACAFGRGIGDAASVLFTAGYTDRIPTSLMRPTASLPLAVFFQLGSPYPEVRERGYAAALILTIIVLAVSFGARWLSARLNKYTVK